MAGALAVAVLGATVAPSTVEAQGPERPAADSASPPPRPARPAPVRRLDRENVVAVQPIHALFGAYSAEYERFVGGLFSVAGAVTYTDGEILDWNDYADEPAFLTTDMKLRFYPDARSFHGLSLGIHAGARRGREYQVSGDPPRLGDREWRWNPTIGFTVERGWLDQRTGRTLVATGIGAKRVLRSGAYDDESYLTLRFAVGLAF